jgi:hypothetical protein
LRVQWQLSEHFRDNCSCEGCHEENPLTHNVSVSAHNTRGYKKDGREHAERHDAEAIVWGDVSESALPKTFLQHEQACRDDKMKIDVYFAQIWHGRVSHDHYIDEKVDEFHGK